MPGHGDFTVSAVPAGVDFPYILFADQIGEPVERCRGKSGVGWLRMVTDVPTVLSDLLRGDFDLAPTSVPCGTRRLNPSSPVKILFLRFWSCCCCRIRQ